MAVQCDDFKVFTATNALEAFRRVKLSAASGTAVEYAGAGESFIGITQSKVEAGDPVTVKLLSSENTYKVTLAKDVAAGTALYGAASGKFSDAVNGNQQGTLLEASSADGDVVESLLTGGPGSSINGASVLNVADSTPGIPVILREQISGAGAQTVNIFNANAPRKFIVIDAWLYATAANANGTVKLTNGANDITDAMVCAVDQVV